MKRLFLIFLLIALGTGFYFYKKDKETKANTISSAEITASSSVEQIVKEVKKDKIIQVEITEGATYGYLMATSGIEYATSTAIYESAKPLYDLVKIRIGRVIEFVYDKDDDGLKELRYKLDSEDELHVKNTYYYSTSSDDIASSSVNIYQNWIAQVIPIPYEIKTKTAGGTVDSSMYQAALNNDIDIRAIIELANAFQWSIDFAMDPRVGDTFRFIYEERYLDGEYVMPGAVLAGYYINEGTKYQLYYFEEDEKNIGFFDEDGNSVQKMFLKSPVEFKYISSGYTTGNRVVMEIGLSGAHRAIDYAAPIGTPIRSVGDGRITFAGWKTGYGYITSVHHNGTYSTNYAHQSKILVSVGQKVKQGEIIGKVGSTGWSTGPHLHYEMVKNGSKINPLKEVLPPGKPIKDENKERFLAEVEKYDQELNK